MVGVRGEIEGIDGKIGRIDRLFEFCGEGLGESIGIEGGGARSFLSIDENEFAFVCGQVVAIPETVMGIGRPVSVDVMSR